MYTGKGRGCVARIRARHGGTQHSPCHRAGRNEDFQVDSLRKENPGQLRPPARPGRWERAGPQPGEGESRGRAKGRRLAELREGCVSGTQLLRSQAEDRGHGGMSVLAGCTSGGCGGVAVRRARRHPGELALRWLRAFPGHSLCPGALLSPELGTPGAV